MTKMPKDFPVTGIPNFERVHAIMGVVARHFGTTVERMKGQSRKSSEVVPRHVAMYLTYRMTERSTGELARLFGGRDHTTILHGVNNVTERMEKDEDFAHTVRDLATEIGGVVHGTRALDVSVEEVTRAVTAYMGTLLRYHAQHNPVPLLQALIALGAVPSEGAAEKK